MPLISIQKGAPLGLHIAACVNGEKNYNWNSNADSNFVDHNGMTKGKWYTVEVGQKYENSDYLYYIIINGQQVHQKINKNATTFDEMLVYLSVSKIFSHKVDLFLSNETKCIFKSITKGLRTME